MAAAQAVNDYFAAKKGIVYINVLNNLSIHCDDLVDKPTDKDIGMAASLHRLPSTSLCLDQVFNLPKEKEEPHTGPPRHATSVTASASCTVLRKWVLLH